MSIFKVELKDEIEYDDDFCLAYYKGERFFRGSFEMFEEFELEDDFNEIVGDDYYTGRDLLDDTLEWDENKKCYSGNGFELFIFDVMRGDEE